MKLLSPIRFVSLLLISACLAAPAPDVKSTTSADNQSTIGQRPSDPWWTYFEEERKGVVFRWTVQFGMHGRPLFTYDTASSLFDYMTRFLDNMRREEGAEPQTPIRNNRFEYARVPENFLFLISPGFDAIRPMRYEDVFFVFQAYERWLDLWGQGSRIPACRLAVTWGFSKEGHSPEGPIAHGDVTNLIGSADSGSNDNKTETALETS